jgi:hypothetical protein
LEVITGNREDIIWGMSDRIGVGEVSSSPDWITNEWRQ